MMIHSGVGYYLRFVFLIYFQPPPPLPPPQKKKKKQKKKTKGSASPENCDVPWLLLCHDYRKRKVEEGPWFCSSKEPRKELEGLLVHQMCAFQWIFGLMTMNAERNLGRRKKRRVYYLDAGYLSETLLISFFLSLPRVINFKLLLQPHVPEILHHTVWRTWFFISYSDERRLTIPILTGTPIHFP